VTDEPFDQRTQDEAFAELEQALPRVAPPPALLQQIVDEIRDQDTATLPPEKPRAVRWSRWRWRFVVPALAGLAVALVAIIVIVSGSSGEQSDLQVAVTSDGGAVGGSLELFDPQQADAHVVVALTGLAPAPAGYHYTAWILDQATDEMTPIGSFDSTGSTTELRLPLPGPGEYVAFDISLQADAAPPAHSGTSVAGARLG